MFKKAMIAGAVVFASVGAHAASAELTVTGTITPEACNLTVDNSGKLDYGSLGAATVKTYAKWNGTHYKLPAKAVGAVVNCSSAAKFALSVVDNKATTKDGALQDGDAKFGFGAYKGTNIGFVQLNTKSVMIQSAGRTTLIDAASSYTRASNTGPWMLASGSIATSYLKQGVQIAYSENSDATRSDIEALSKLALTLLVEPMISDAVVDNATESVTAAASMTILLNYV